MFLVMALLLAAQADVGADRRPPLETIRLTQMQMFQLQLPYRYKVSLATIERDGLGRWELQVTDYYCNALKKLEVVQIPYPDETRPPLRRNAIRGRLVLQIDDCLWFPDDRYHVGSFILAADGEYLLVINDRVEKKVLWPLEVPQQPVP